MSNIFRRQKAQEILGSGEWTEEELTAAWMSWRDANGFEAKHGIVSIDLSQIELVLIGEASGDEAFKEAYGQLPYKDLHLTAGAAILKAVTDRQDFTRDDFIQLKLGKNVKNIPLVDAKGNELTPAAAYKYNRGNAGGKGANFEYWFSGHLATLAERRGLGSDAAQMLVQAYADAFPTAVAWRQALAGEVQQTGEVLLPDGHKRVRYEATFEWQGIMNNYFRSLAQGMEPDDRAAVLAFGDLVVRKISRRAQNQIINARIQGTCAAIIKRSILRIRKEVLPVFDCRFMFPIHDELVFSVNYDHMFDFLHAAQPIMANHPDIVKDLVMNSSASIGRTFQPFDPDNIERVPYGQIELNEAPPLPFVPKEMVGKTMSDDVVKLTIAYLKG